MLIRYREATITLRGIGIELDSLEDAKKAILGLKVELHEAQTMKDRLGKDY